jgi:hypothetical protein
MQAIPVSLGVVCPTGFPSCDSIDEISMALPLFTPFTAVCHQATPSLFIAEIRGDEALLGVLKSLLNNALADDVPPRWVIDPAVGFAGERGFSTSS